MPHILVDPLLKEIAEKYERSTAQIVLRWLLQRGLVTIPKVMRFLNSRDLIFAYNEHYTFYYNLNQII